MQATGPARSDAPRLGLSTASAAIPEAACSGGLALNHQPYELYSKANHITWQSLYCRNQELWARYANERFLEGLEYLRLPEDRVPRLDEVTAFLAPRTGFRAEPLSGYLPAFTYFDSLKQRKLPTAITIRGADSSDNASEPDIFHDVAGHAPMHADRAFGEALMAFGTCAHTAVELVSPIREPEEQLRRLTSLVKALTRFFWFTVESGLVRCGNVLKAYGSGLLSSGRAIEHAIDSPQVQRTDLNLDWVIHQPFETGRQQPLLFIVESFEHLLELTGTLEKWMRAGRLDHVSGGKPDVCAADLDSFLQVCETLQPSRLRSSRILPYPLSHRKRLAHRRLSANLS